MPDDYTGGVTTTPPAKLLLLLCIWWAGVGVECIAPPGSTLCQVLLGHRCAITTHISWCTLTSTALLAPGCRGASCVRWKRMTCVERVQRMRGG